MSLRRICRYHSFALMNAAGLRAVDSLTVPLLFSGSSGPFNGAHEIGTFLVPNNYSANTKEVTP